MRQVQNHRRQDERENGAAHTTDVAEDDAKVRDVGCGPKRARGERGAHGERLRRADGSRLVAFEHVFANAERGLRHDRVRGQQVQAQQQLHRDPRRAREHGDDD